MGILYFFIEMGRCVSSIAKINRFGRAYGTCLKSVINIYDRYFYELIIFGNGFGFRSEFVDVKLDNFLFADYKLEPYSVVNK